MSRYFACYADIKERELSSSGGIYPVIADYILDKQGVVYATVYDTDFSTVFKRFDSKINIRESYGSKYVQSRLEDTFLSLKKDLDNNRIVLFCGTPCQVAGIKSYLEKSNTKTEKFYSLDFICHGVPSQKIWMKYLEEKNKSKNLRSINMRSKKSGWSYSSYSFEYNYGDSSEVIKNTNDIYMIGYLSNLFLRPSCYSCRFKGDKGYFSDMTLADFWGVDRVLPEMDDNKGTTKLIVHSEKGQFLFRNISKKDCIKICETDYDAINEFNRSYIEGVRKNSNRQKFFKDINRGADVTESINKYCKLPIYKKILRKVFGMVSLFKNKKISNSVEFYKGKVYSSKTNCVGCTACKYICSKESIQMKFDSEGFLYPEIDVSKCINCKKCLKVCPMKY